MYSHPADSLRLDPATRARLWNLVGEAIETYRADAAGLEPAPTARRDEVRRALERFDFEHPLSPDEAIAEAVRLMRRWQPHVTHPRHFGLFDPAPTAMGVLGEALTAAFNPCLATWAGSPVGVEVERLLVERFGCLFGYRPETVDGTLTTGGSEANLTGLLLALTARFPDHRDTGLRGLTAEPAVYVGEQAHPSWLKAVRIVGLGSRAIRIVPLDDAGRTDAAALDRAIASDRAAGYLPLLIAATAGTTAAGVVDPIDDIADVATRHNGWIHVDAAWGGAAQLLAECRPVLNGIARADSITFDPHKWLSVPMGCGMLLTRHRGLLERTFSVSATFLTGDDEADLYDPAGRTIRWSRSFAGLKLLLSLGVAGWRGYEEVLRQQVRLADRLRQRLREDDWEITNRTVLPVVCFAPSGTASDTDQLRKIAGLVNRSRQARVFQVRAGGRSMLRACVTNYATTEADIDVLANLLHAAREAAEHRVDPAVLLDADGAETRCSDGLLS